MKLSEALSIKTACWTVLRCPSLCGRMTGQAGRNILPWARQVILDHQHFTVRNTHFSNTLPFIGSDCKKIIELKADMNRIPEQFRSRTTGRGEKYYKIPFTIEMTWRSANIEFKLVHTTENEQRYECGADSIKADYLQ